MARYSTDQQLHLNMGLILDVSVHGKIQYRTQVNGKDVPKCEAQDLTRKQGTLI